MIAALDPGIRGCGVAVFTEHLVAAAYLKNPILKGNGMDAIREMASACAYFFCARQSMNDGTELLLVVEWPQVYREKKRSGRQDPADLFPLAAIGAAVQALLGVPAVRYLPREWKGTINPEECTRRVRARLGMVEFAHPMLPSNTCAECRKQDGERCTKPSCLAHNVYDAIGIGLKHLGRFDRYRAIAR